MGRRGMKLENEKFFNREMVFEKSFLSRRKTLEKSDEIQVSLHHALFQFNHAEAEQLKHEGYAALNTTINFFLLSRKGKKMKS